MRELTSFELGYHAAAIDGEGTICIGTHSKDTKNYNPKIQVTNTNKLFMEYLYRTTKIGLLTPKTGRTLKAKNFWLWDLRKYEIKPYLLQIKDFLIAKKIQAELMLEFLELYKECYSRSGVPEHIIIQRMAIYLEMQELNKRGT
jgi:hypothetical protein